MITPPFRSKKDKIALRAGRRKSSKKGKKLQNYNIRELVLKVAESGPKILI
jgi:hypothetical protein